MNTDDELETLLRRQNALLEILDQRLVEIDDHVRREGTYATSAIEGAERRIVAFVGMMFALGMVALWVAT